jgi:hypothetical protein
MKTSVFNEAMVNKLLTSAYVFQEVLGDTAGTQKICTIFVRLSDSAFLCWLVHPFEPF